jgi:hypothetical protein
MSDTHRNAKPSAVVQSNPLRAAPAVVTHPPAAPPLVQQADAKSTPGAVNPLMAAYNWGQRRSSLGARQRPSTDGGAPGVVASASGASGAGSVAETPSRRTSLRSGGTPRLLRLPAGVGGRAAKPVVDTSAGVRLHVKRAPLSATSLQPGRAPAFVSVGGQMATAAARSSTPPVPLHTVVAPASTQPTSPPLAVSPHTPLSSRGGVGSISAVDTAGAAVWTSMYGPLSPQRQADARRMASEPQRVSVAPQAPARSLTPLSDAPRLESPGPSDASVPFVRGHDRAGTATPSSSVDGISIGATARNASPRGAGVVQLRSAAELVGLPAVGSPLKISVARANGEDMPRQGHRHVSPAVAGEEHDATRRHRSSGDTRDGSRRHHRSHRSPSKDRRHAGDAGAAATAATGGGHGGDGGGVGTSGRDPSSTERHDGRHRSHRSPSKDASSGDGDASRRRHRSRSRGRHAEGTAPTAAAVAALPVTAAAPLVLPMHTRRRGGEHPTGSVPTWNDFV